MIYIHIPYCRSFCSYCGFYSVICRDYDGFVDALRREISSRKGEIDQSKKNTLYIGGGTPSVLPLSALKSIVDALPGGDYEEFTIEVNPDDVTKEYAEGLRALGTTRVSMGVQSFDDEVLRWMNRRHDAVGAERAFRTLRAAGFDNISIDLIFGYPAAGGSWLKTLEKALELRPEHISAYQLSIEDGSVLQEKGFEPARDELCAEQYSLLCHSLAHNGYEHYEISNFALPGRRALHNSGYWDRTPYLGLGPAAHSFDGLRTRCWNSQAPLSWQREGSETLSDNQILEEKIMLGLRTSDGISESLVAGSPNYSKLLNAESLKKLPEGRVRIPEEKFFVCDDIISELLP